MATNPLGAGTVNLSVNISERFHAELIARAAVLDTDLADLCRIRLAGGVPQLEERLIRSQQLLKRAELELRELCRRKTVRSAAAEAIADEIRLMLSTSSR